MAYSVDSLNSLQCNIFKSVVVFKFMKPDMINCMRRESYTGPLKRVTHA